MSSVAVVEPTRRRSAAAPLRPTVIRPRQLVIDAIVRETGVTKGMATAFVTSIMRRVRECKLELKQLDYATWHPRTRWLQTYHDAVFVKIMPDDTPAAAGSAHARLQDLCSQAIGAPVTLTHTRTEDEDCGLKYCALCIELDCD